MKIKKYNTGGIYYTPFIPNNDNITQSNSTKEATDTNKTTDTFTKETLDILSENGIPNDVDTFLKQANQVLNKSSNSFSNLFGTSEENRYDISDIVKLRSLANKTKFNKQLYDTAAQQLTKERSWSEAAMDDKGRMYVYTEDTGIEVVDPNEYYKNKDAYTALTNSQLMSLRERQPELAYNQNILNNISNSVGTESIVNYLKGVIKDFGTRTIEGYTSKHKDTIEEGFRNILMGGPDGYYKITNKDQGTEKALEYLYTTLPSNMLYALRVKTAAEGGNPNSRQEVLNLLGLALTEHTNHSQELSFSKEATESDGSASGSKKLDEIKLDQLEAIANGRIVEGRVIQLSPADSKIAIEGFAQSYGVPIDKNGVAVSQTNLQQLLDKAEIGKIIDRSSIYFGDQKVDDIDINKVLWDGVSQVNRVILPYTIETDGSYKPNFDSQRKFEEFQKFLDDFPDITNVQKLEKARAMGLDVIYDEESQTFRFDEDAVKPFIVMNGYTSSKTMNIDEDSKWLSHLSTDQGKQITDYYDTQINYGEGFSTKSKKPVNEAKSSRWSMYKSAIFMPIIDTKIATVQNNNELVPTQNYRDILNQAVAKRNRSNMTTNFK